MTEATAKEFDVLFTPDYAMDNYDVNPLEGRDLLYHDDSNISLFDKVENPKPENVKLHKTLVDAANMRRAFDGFSPQAIIDHVDEGEFVTLKIKLAGMIKKLMSAVTYVNIEADIDDGEGDVYVYSYQGLNNKEKNGSPHKRPMREVDLRGSFVIAREAMNLIFAQMMEEMYTQIDLAVENDDPLTARLVDKPNMEDLPALDLSETLAFFLGRQALTSIITVQHARDVDPSFMYFPNEEFSHIETEVEEPEEYEEEGYSSPSSDISLEELKPNEFGTVPVNLQSFLTPTQQELLKEEGVVVINHIVRLSD